MYDIAIIGTGPAGLEAAITAKVRNKNIIVFGIVFGSKESSLKVSKAHAILNYLGLPEISGSDMAAAFLSHAERMGVEITEEQITGIYAMGDKFAIQGAQNMYEAKTVILATGVIVQKPYPNEEKLLGRGVSYCATCDAALYKGKTTVIIGSSPKEEAEADFMTEKTNQREIEADGIFVLREAVAPGQLVPGLETEGPHIKVNVDMSTSIPGCFAAGDIAGLPYQYIKAAGQGNTAALSAVGYLTELEHAGK